MVGSRIYAQHKTEILSQRIFVPCGKCFTNQGVAPLHKRTIWVKTSSYFPGFDMVIAVPDFSDDVEYIDGFLNIVLNDAIRNGIDWEFIDAL